MSVESYSPSDQSLNAVVNQQPSSSVMHTQGILELNDDTSSEGMLTPERYGGTTDASSVPPLL